MNIGFVGLGSMGQGMAGCLLGGGHQVTVWNRSQAPVEGLVAKGAVAAASPGEAVHGDVLISMLADDFATRTVLLESGALAGAAQGLLHINMATVSIDFAREMTQWHAEHGLGYLAAPVFGRSDMAAVGQLNVLVAGDAAAQARAQPLFDLMGRKTWSLGQVAERANAVKLAGNFMIAAAIGAMGEAASLAQGYGVEPAVFLELMTGTLFAAPVYQGYGKLIAESKFEPAGFKAALGAKDVRLALAAGEATNTPMPLASMLRDQLIDAIAHGEGDLDWAVLGKVAARRAGRA